MSTQLQQLGIEIIQGYEAKKLPMDADVYVIGNALSRGNSSVEAILNHQLPYQSGPQWLTENCLQKRWVIAVAGTHGKTTTTSMIAWILEYCGFKPGFLIGGCPANFDRSARWGEEPYFVIEADEYDCAFFDKRSKFVHYRPKTCVLNNLEFDHADLFNHLDEIKKQFHHLVRTVPGNGALIVQKSDPALQDVLTQGYYSELITFGQEGDWQAHCLAADGSVFEVAYRGKTIGQVHWTLIGQHNVYNGLAAIAASAHAGMFPKEAVNALCEFKSVKRRLECCGKVKNVTVYDDFAHHPTAIASTLQGLRANVKAEKIIAVLDIRSNTMCLGTHQAQLPQALLEADEVFIYRSEKVRWDIGLALKSVLDKVKIYDETQAIVDSLMTLSQVNTHIVIMSNGGFEGLTNRLITALEKVAEFA